MEHCKDHQTEHDCKIKMEASLESIKKDGHSKLNDLTAEVRDVWETMKTKIDTATFKLVVWMIVIGFGTILSGSFTMLWSINTKVSNIAIEQAGIAGTLKAQRWAEDPLSRTKP